MNGNPIKTLSIERGISESILKSHLRIGQSDNSWYQILLRNEYGGVVGRVTYSPRAEPKYIKDIGTTTGPIFFNGQNLREVFYGKALFLTEGVFDALSFTEVGAHSVALLGTDLNQREMDTLTRYTNKIILALDNDTAGAIATERIIEKFPKFNFYKFRIQGAKDANDLLRQDRNEFKRQLDQFLAKI